MAPASSPHLPVGIFTANLPFWHPGRSAIALAQLVPLDDAGRLQYRRALRDGRGPPRSLAEQVKLLQDLGRLVVDELEPRKLACRDSLTGVLTRRGLDMAVQRLITKPDAEVASVIMMDLDHFKRISDTHGHGVGDRILQAIVAASRSVLRPQDILARVGGEEFAIIPPGLVLAEGLKAAERMRKSIAANVTMTREGPISVTASFGVAATLSGISDFEDVMAAAVGAMYAAKAGGRDAVREAVPAELNHLVSARL